MASEMAWSPCGWNEPITSPTILADFLKAEPGSSRTVNSVIVLRGAAVDGALEVGSVAFDHPVVMVQDVLPQANLGSRALRADAVEALAAHRDAARAARVSR